MWQKYTIPSDPQEKLPVSSRKARNFLLPPRVLTVCILFGPSCKYMINTLYGKLLSISKWNMGNYPERICVTAQGSGLLKQDSLSLKTFIILNMYRKALNWDIKLQRIFASDWGIFRSEAQFTKHSHPLWWTGDRRWFWTSQLHSANRY